MCNEVARLRALGEIVEAFSELKIPLTFPEGSPNLAATDSIRITDPAAIVRRHDGAHQLVQRRWSWAGPVSGTKPGKPVYNTRSEGRRFVNSATGGRCLIPLDGFYEFTDAAPGSKRKTKWLFTMPDGDPVGGADNTLATRGLFCVAGLWRAAAVKVPPKASAVIPAEAGTHDHERLSSWVPASAGMTATSNGDAAPVSPSAATEAFTMLTCAPGPDIAPYHSRQIVLMPREHWGAWLAGAEGLTLPTPAGTLRVERVG